MAAQKRRRRKNRNSRTKVILATVAVLVVVIVAVVAYFSVNQNGSEEPGGESDTGAVQEASGPINPLTGQLGFDADKLGARPVAIMINNAPAARPQWGLCSPDIVFEGLVEGGATRMMWVYADANDIPKVGSIRSARHDFVELAEGMDAIFVHWGGSDLAYDAISDRDVDDIDGLRYEGTYFFRDSTRSVATEHRGYTTGEDIRAAIDDLELRTQAESRYQNLFSFEKEGAPRLLSGGSCQSVSFDFSGAGSYSHTFNYDAQDGLYYNRIGGEPMRQDGGEQMAVTNVLLLYCDVRNLGDSSGHMEMDLSSGSGLYISNGTYEEIEWEKGSASAPLKLRDSAGKALVLNAGKSYIGMVPTSEQSSVAIS